MLKSIDTKTIAALNDAARRVTVVLAALIRLTTLIPAQQLPDAPGTDKLHHVVAFGLLGLPMSFAKPQHFWKYALYEIMFGIFIEIAQPVFYRNDELRNMLADFIGVVIGCAIGVGLRKLIGRSALSQ